MKELITSTTAMKSKLMAIEKYISNMPGAYFNCDEDACPLKHKFTPGIYTREILIPKGTLLVGKLHKYEHLSMMISGMMTVLGDDGNWVRIKGPLTTIAPAGTKRAGYAHTDVVWITVHENPTNETDVDKIVKHLTVDTFEEYELFIENIRRLK
jgi:hypothetical protein